MDAQELRNLQEAYMEVYDEGYKLFPYRKVKTKQKQIATDYDSLGKKPLTGKSESEISDTLNNLERLRNRKTTLGFVSNVHHPDDVRAKENKNKRKYQLSPGETTAQRARRDPEFRTRMIKDRMKTMEGYDLYDVILSHLLDEGYKPPAGKMAKRVAHKMFKGVNTLIKAKDAGEILDTTVGGQVAVQKSDKLAKQAQKIYQTAKRHNPEDSKEKERQNRAVGDTAREVGPRAAASLRDRYNRGGSSTNTPKKKNGYWKDIRDGIINGVSDALGEQVDLYDIILSHLLDEGYADTVENAESIMVNMSKDWRESIVEARVDAGKTDDQKIDARNRRRDGDEYVDSAKFSPLPGVRGDSESDREIDHLSSRGKKKPIASSPTRQTKRKEKES